MPCSVTVFGLRPRLDHPHAPQALEWVVKSFKKVTEQGKRGDGLKTEIDVQRASTASIHGCIQLGWRENVPDVPSFAMRHVPVVPFAMAQESRKGFAIYTTRGRSGPNGGMV